MSFFPRRIPFATDGSADARLARQAAVELSTSTGSELHVAHVGEFLPTILAQTDVEPEQLEREARETLDGEVAQIGAEGGDVAESHLRLGQPDREIVRLGEELDCGLIVLGSQGLTGMRRALMGSVSESVVRHAHCPVVLVVRE